MSNRLTTLCWGFALGKFEQVWLFNSLAWQHPHTPLSVHICLLYQIHPIQVYFTHGYLEKNFI